MIKVISFFYQPRELQIQTPVTLNLPALLIQYGISKAVPDP
jgi:hypothetical protein